MTSLLRRGDHTEMPWRNGGGSTLEVARHPAGSDLDDMEWRISFAQVAGDGPFSVFDGVDRILTLVEGEWMQLTLTDDTGEVSVRELRPFESFEFPGEDEIDCEVPHPTTDLNVMTRRDAYAATVSTRHLGGDFTLDASGPGETRVVAVLHGEPVAEIDGEAVTLGPLDVVVGLDEPLRATGTGVVALITLSPRH